LKKDTVGARGMIVAKLVAALCGATYQFLEDEGGKALSGSSQETTHTVILTQRRRKTPTYTGMATFGVGPASFL
jgi:hypothetical protein